MSDKPSAIRNLEPMTRAEQVLALDRYRARAESLLAVDEMVEDLVATLQAEGELDNTVIVFTSDNGFFHGEHRLPVGKARFYEESIGVPLLMRGPGIPAGALRSQLVGNIDLAPTIADIAGAEPGRPFDGQTLLPLAEDDLVSPGRGIGLEAYFASDSETPPVNYRAVRTDRYVYAEHGNGEQELYDLVADPSQLESRHADPAFAAVKRALGRLLATTADCAGSVCRATPALELRVSFNDGGGCVTAGVRARLAGGSRDEVLTARFYGNGMRSGHDGEAPFEGSVGADLLRTSGENLVTANATMLDGRVVTIEARVPPAC